jgi:linoleoyl-CoA desaturase
MGIGMAGVGMNVMHDGNHGSYSNKTGSINSWVVRFIFLQEMYTTGRYNTMYYTTPTNIPGHDEDLDAGRIIRFTRGKMAFFPSLQQYLCIFIWFINFQLNNN